MHARDDGVVSAETALLVQWRRCSAGARVACAGAALQGRRRRLPHGERVPHRLGVTNNLEQRVDEHKRKRAPGSTGRNNARRSVHAETHADPRSAIARQKQIMGWRPSQTVELRDRGVDHPA